MRLHPEPTITPEALAAGQRSLVRDAAWASMTGALSGGVVLVAMALQLGAVLTVGAQAVWPENPVARGLFARLPKGVQSRVRMVADWTAADIAIDAVLHHGDSDQLRTVCEQVAARPGPIIGVQGLAQGEPNVALDRLLIERSLSVNTAAAGGNASLMTIG